MFRSAAMAAMFAVPLLIPTPVAAQTWAEDFAARQDFDRAPPALGAGLRDILWFVRPNRTYDSSGPPFQSPRPPLPQHLTSVYARCRSGSYATSSSPRCVKTWSDCFVWLRFDDGSDWTFEQYESTERCSDGSSSRFTRIAQVADAGPPGNRDLVVHVQSYTAEQLQTSRRRGCAAGAGATVSAFAGVTSRPAVGGGSFELTVGPGGVLDLRQNAAAGGPLFVTDTPALLHCDQILLDPGVTLTDLFSLPPIVQPAALLPEIDLVVPAFLALDDGSPANARIVLHNPGNAATNLVLSWSDLRGWVPPGQTTIALPAGAIVPYDLQVQVPPAAQTGDLDIVQVRASSQQNPALVRTAELRIAHDPPGVFRFAPGTPGCQGPHGIDADRALAAGGPAQQLSCTQAAPSAPALWLFGVDVAPAFGTRQLPGLAAALHVDPFGPVFVSVFTLASPAGIASHALQIPPNPGFQGMPLAAQVLLLWSTPCPQLQGPISSSPALGLVVQ